VSRARSKEKRTNLVLGQPSETPRETAVGKKRVRVELDLSEASFLHADELAVVVVGRSQLRFFGKRDGEEKREKDDAPVPLSRRDLDNKVVVVLIALDEAVELGEEGFFARVEVMLNEREMSTGLFNSASASLRRVCGCRGEVRDVPGSCPALWRATPCQRDRSS
jgi:hypothetical protein